MWRFPICRLCSRTLAQLPSTSTSSVRCKHDVATAPPAPEFTAPRERHTWFAMQDHPSRVPEWSPRGDNVTTFAAMTDDFGVLSLNGASSNDSLSSASDSSSFLDHLLNVDSTRPTLFPTTEECELGGGGELEGCLERMLGDGYDVSSMIQDLAEANFQKDALAQSIETAALTGTAAAPPPESRQKRNVSPARSGVRRMLAEGVRAGADRRTVTTSAAAAVAPPSPASPVTSVPPSVVGGAAGLVGASAVGAQPVKDIKPVPVPAATAVDDDEDDSPFLFQTEKKVFKTVESLKLTPTVEEKTSLVMDVPLVKHRIHPRYKNMPVQVGSTAAAAMAPSSPVVRTPSQTVHHPAHRPASVVSTPAWHEEEVRVQPLEVPVVDRFSPRTDRQPMDEEETWQMQAAVAAQDMSIVRSLLSCRVWPSARELSGERGVERLLAMVVEKAVDTKEAEEMLADYAASSARACLPVSVCLVLAGRVASESSVTEAVRSVTTTGDKFISKQVSSRHNVSLNPMLESLYSSVLSRSASREATGVHDMLIEQQLVGGDQASAIFIREVVRKAVASGTPFDSLYMEWLSLCERYGSVHAVGEVMEAAVRGEEAQDGREMAKRIGSVLSASAVHAHPLSSLAELVCALVRVGRVEDARAIFSKIAIGGRHLRTVLRRWCEKQENLVYVEQLAELMTACIYGERRRGGRKKEGAVAGEVVAGAEAAGEKMSPVVSSELLQQLMQFCGAAGNGKRRVKYGKDGKPEKMKRHKVDDEQLHDLAAAMVEAWSGMAVRAGSRSSAERLLAWTAKHRVDVPAATRSKLQALVKKEEEEGERM